MTQIRSLNWLANDSTSLLNTRTVGSTPYGRYYGFSWDGSPALTANFVHTNDGYTIVNSDSPITTIPNVGEWRTKQGVIIRETASIGVSFDAPSTLDRIDLLVGQHEYVQSAGGAIALYVVIQGVPSATPVAPTLTQPDKQVILGSMYIPANGIDLTDATFTRTLKPSFAGDNSIAHVDRKQIFTEEQVISAMSSEYGTCYLDVPNNLIDLSKDYAGVPLTGDSLALNLKKNKFVLRQIISSPTLVNSIVPYPHSFNNECKDVSIFTLSPLILSATNFLTNHGANSEVKSLTTVDLITVEDFFGIGTGANNWSILSGSNALVNARNVFTQTNSWNKGTGTLPSTGIAQYAGTGNYLDLATTPTTSTLKAIQSASSSGGTIMVIKGTGEPLTLVHNTLDLVTKRLWLPEQKDFTSYSDSEVFIFVEDINYWRLIGTYNQVDSWHFVGGANNLGTSFQHYQNGINFASPLKFRKTSENKVTLMGYVDKVVLNNTDNIVFTLPIGYRPSVPFQTFNVVASAYRRQTGNFEYNLPCRLWVGDDGTVFMNSYDGLEAISNLDLVYSNVFINLEFLID